MAEVCRMGMEYVVEPADELPKLASIREILAGEGYSLQTRMIDGQLAFPDEEPKGPWSELRVAINKNMITLRHDGRAIHVLTWGNADDAMQVVWKSLVWAIAESSKGKVISPDGVLSASEFRETLR